MHPAAYTSHRTVTHLKWAHPLSERPDFIPAAKPRRAAPAAGLRFERALAKALPLTAIHGQWFKFADSQAESYCQTDYLLTLHLPSPVGTAACIIEAKYTLVPGAHSKLLNLYIPVVSMALSLPAVGIVIVKNLDPRYRRGRIHTTLAEAAIAAHETHYPSLIQWSGQPLLPALPRGAQPPQVAA